MHQGALLAPTKAGRRWWPTSPSCRMGREEYYTRELATDHEQYLSGHGESSGRWWRRGAAALAAGRSIAGGVPGHVRGSPPRHRRAAGPPAWSQCGAGVRRGLWPTKSVSVLYGLVIRRLDRRCSPPTSWCREAVAYLDGHLGSAAAAGRARRPDRGCWGSGPTIGRPGRGSAAAHHLVVANQIQGPEGLTARTAGRHRHYEGRTPSTGPLTSSRPAHSASGTAADRHGTWSPVGGVPRPDRQQHRAPVAIGTRAVTPWPVARRAGHLQPGHPRRAWPLLGGSRAGSRVPAGGGSGDLQPSPSRRLRLRCRGVVVGPPARPGSDRGHVQALERGSSKVQMVADALAMLGEVWDVRRTRTNPVGGEVGPGPPLRSEAALTAGCDPPLAAVDSSTGAPPALQTS